MEEQLNSELLGRSIAAIARLTYDYESDDMQIGFNSSFLTEMITILNSDNVPLEMSLADRSDILIRIDRLDKEEDLTVFVITMMLND